MNRRAALGEEFEIVRNEERFTRERSNGNLRCWRRSDDEHCRHFGVAMLERGYGAVVRRSLIIAMQPVME